jgi:hypothetical protein
MTSSHALPPDLLESQISTLDLLLAMFPDESEFDITPSDLALITNIRDNGSDGATSPLPSEIHLALHVSLDPTHSIQVNVTAPLRIAESDPIEAPPISFSLRQPTWLDKASLATLSSSLPEDIFSALDTLRDQGTSLIPTSNTPLASKVSTGPLVRVWFYFPSLSTREKRQHMVDWAPSYSLTGFVLAGKPGMLCLEGSGSNIDAYMNEIKTVSWGDIPSHQKKVSERYRETGDEVKRAFEGMIEITDLVGEKHGARQNRGDMAAIEAWLKGKGLGDMFESVILQS